MKIGNILASIGIILGILGLTILPINNFFEIPHIADPNVKGSGWIVLIQTGVFVKSGISLILIGGLLFLVAKILPKKYWKTSDDLLLDEIDKINQKKN